MDHFIGEQYKDIRLFFMFAQKFVATSRIDFIYFEQMFCGIYMLTSESMYDTISAFNQSRGHRFSPDGAQPRGFDIGIIKGGSAPLFFLFCC